MVRSHWLECHSVCLPNRNLGDLRANRSYSESIRWVLGAYLLFCLAFDSSKYSLTFRILRPCIFGKYSEIILGAYGMYRKRLGSMRIVIGAFRNSKWTYNMINPFQTLSERYQANCPCSESIWKTCEKQSQHAGSMVYSESILKYSERKRNAFSYIYIGANLFGETSVQAFQV